MPSDSGELKRREFLHFLDRRRKRTGAYAHKMNKLSHFEAVIPCKQKIKWPEPVIYLAFIIMAVPAYTV